MRLSENAAAALESIRESQGIPEAHDTRLAADQHPTGGLAVRLEFVEEVSENDQVTEQSGTEVYVDPQIAGPLEDSVMDVQAGDEGLEFVFRAEA